MAVKTRYLAQNLVTKEWVHTDLPLVDVEIEHALSGPGGIDAKIEPRAMGLRTGAGDLVLAEWQTAIYAERDGRIRGAGIFVRAEQGDDPQTLEIECPGFTAYPHGVAYLGEWRRWRPDPFDAVRELWNHMQSYADGDLGMQVTSRSSGTAVGDFRPPVERPKTAEAALRAPAKGPKPVQGTTETYEDWVERVESWDVDYANRKLIYKAARAKAKTDKERLKNAQQEWDSLYKDRTPYQLNWWEAVDCGEEIDRLATETPFEYAEYHSWDDDHQEVEHVLSLGYPQLGRRRDDLRFAIGENVRVIPSPLHDGDDFANHVLGLGKGEGRKMLRSSVGARDGRLRRMAVVSWKDVGNQSRLRALTASELRNRRTMAEIEELEVISHQNAPLGSWSLGDEILLDTTGYGWLEERMWVRIIGHRFNPDDDERLVLQITNAERA